jgi:hypothetical protein
MYTNLTKSLSISKMHAIEAAINRKFKVLKNKHSKVFWRIGKVKSRVTR